MLFDLCEFSQSFLLFITQFVSIVLSFVYVSTFPSSLVWLQWIGNSMKICNRVQKRVRNKRKKRRMKQKKNLVVLIHRIILFLSVELTQLKILIGHYSSSLKTKITLQLNIFSVGIMKLIKQNKILLLSQPIKLRLSKPIQTKRILL